MDTTLTIRTKKSLKNKASKILQKKGLNLSSALNMYLHKIVDMPKLEVHSDFFDNLTANEERRVKKIKEDYLKGKGQYSTLDEYESKRLK